MSAKDRPVPPKPPRNRANAGQGQNLTEEEDPNRYKVPLSKSKSTHLPGIQNGFCLPPTSAYEMLVEIPKDVSGLSMHEVLQCLRCLNLTKHVETFLTGQVDGELLVSIDREMLTAEFGFPSFEAMKLEKFARHGWRPKLVCVHDQPASLFEKTCATTQKNVKSHVFWILKKT